MAYQTLIEKWFLGIFLSDVTENTYHYFPEIINLFANEITKPEHIFLHLYNKGLITGNRRVIEAKKETLEAQLPVSFNGVGFYLTDLGKETLSGLKQMITNGIPGSNSLIDLPKSCHPEHQYDLGLKLEPDGTPKNKPCNK